MTKKLATLMSLVLVLCLLAGCVGTPVICTENHSTTAPTESLSTENIEVTNTGSTVVETEGALKTGLAIVANLSESANATQAKYDITMVSVLVDDNGVIHDCIIDGIAKTVEFDATGTITADLTAPVQTKNELGDSYGMVAWGGAKYEWYVQADALAQYAVGKTVEELRSGAVNEQGKAPEGTDLAATATIYLGGYVSAIEKAVAGATHLGAQAGDTLKMATVNGLGNSVSATAEANGTVQLDCDVAVVTEKDGVVTSCYIDSLQAKVTFDATGTISTDLTTAPLTKNELGANYGMVAWGGAVAEWDAQAAAVAAYCTGKNEEAIRGIGYDEQIPVDGVDATASVTIYFGNLVELILAALTK